MNEYRQTESQTITAFYELIRKGGTDSIRGNEEFTAICDILKEISAEKRSRKVKSILKTRGVEGSKLTTIPIYGYALDPDGTNKWVIDPEAADVVRLIYQMYLDGKKIYHIAKALKDEQILSPAAYMAEKGAGKFRNAKISDPYKWSAQTVTNMIEMPEYMGSTVNFKTYKVSHKTGAKKTAPCEDWVIFENTQEAIIDKKTWETAQLLRKTSRRAVKNASSPRTSVIQDDI